jgi:hypothetical protein
MKPFQLPHPPSKRILSWKNSPYTNFVPTFSLTSNCLEVTYFFCQSVILKKDCKLGDEVGVVVGCEEGCDVGCPEGCPDGTDDGTQVGDMLGTPVGTLDGHEGSGVGLPVGCEDG